MAEKISTQWPAHCHVTYHVHVVEFKETAHQQILWCELIEPNLPRKEHVIGTSARIHRIIIPPSLKAKMFPFHLVLFVSLQP